MATKMLITRVHLGVESRYESISQIGTLASLQQTKRPAPNVFVVQRLHCITDGTSNLVV